MAVLVPQVEPVILRGAAARKHGEYIPLTRCEGVKVKRAVVNLPPAFFAAVTGAARAVLVR